MQLSSLFPRPLVPPQPGEASGECAALLGAIFVRIYFERARARRLGWRGILPGSGGPPSWTCRAAGSEHTFGILFEGEEALAGGRGLRGSFGLYVFPEASSPLLDSFPLRALATALREDYPRLRRDFAGREYLEEAAAFCAGRLHLEVALGTSSEGDGLALRLEAPARKRRISLDGVYSAAGLKVLPPGGLETDYPALRLLLPLFAVLSKSLEEIFGETGRYSCGRRGCPPEAFDRRGRITQGPGPQGILVRLQTNLGAEAPGGARLPHRLRALPLEAERGRNVLREERPVLHVLTGFLGAGKTTLLKEWLNFLHDKNRFTGVMQNEFGKVGLDALLLKGEAVVEELDEGCVCCSLADSLRPGLQRLLAALPARECILETTGLANPEYVLAALAELDDLAVPGLTLTLVDALELAASLRPAPDGSAALPELEGIRLAQIRAADLLVLNKADAVGEAELLALERSLRALNGTAEILRAAWGRIPFARLDELYEGVARRRAREREKAQAESGGSGTGRVAEPAPGFTLRPLKELEEARRSEHGRPHELEGFSSRLLEFHKPIGRTQLLEILREFTPVMCRIKGLVEIADEGPTTVQYAAGRLRMEPGPPEGGQGERSGYLVLIGNNLSLRA